MKKTTSLIIKRIVLETIRLVSLVCTFTGVMLLCFSSNKIIIGLGLSFFGSLMTAVASIVILSTFSKKDKSNKKDNYIENKEEKD